MERLSHYIDLIDSIKFISDEYGFSSLHSQIKTVKDLIYENKIIDVAFLGQFKTGKSSFLNNLIGKSLLPVGVIPVTSVITRLSYNDNQKVSITKTDGKTFEINPEEINSFVSESDNPLNKKNILTVDIGLPELKIFKGLRFVDTPGIGSVFRHNTDTTIKWVPQSGIAFFLTSAERPLAESDLSMIRELLEYCLDVVILITKVDLYSKNHLEEVSKFIDDSLQKEINRKFRIYCYSILENTEIYKQKIITQILLPLVDNLEEGYKKILQHKIKSLSAKCLSYLEISYQLSLKKDDVRNKLKKMISDEKLNFHLAKTEVKLISKNYSAMTREKIYLQLNDYRKYISDKVKIIFVNEFDKWNGNLYKLSRRFETFLSDIIKDELLKLITDNKIDLNNTLNILKDHLANYSYSFRKSLNDNIQNALGLQISTENIEFEEDVIIPDISIIKAFNIPLDLIWFLFPMFIFRNVFKKKFINQINSEVETNLHRFTSDLTEKVNQKIESVANQTLQYIWKELSTIETILNTKQGNSEQTKRLMESLAGIE